MIRACDHCGAQNRIPAKFLSARGKCGSCKAALEALSAPLDVDTAEFDAIVKDAKLPVFVDFWAAWCGPCRMAAPEVKALAKLLAGKAIVLKVDTEAHPELAGRFAIQGIPAFVLMRGGRLLAKRAGYAVAADLAEWVRSAGGNNAFSGV
jgi:thioredoxin 2